MWKLVTLPLKVLKGATYLTGIAGITALSGAGYSAFKDGQQGWGLRSLNAISSLTQKGFGYLWPRARAGAGLVANAAQPIISGVGNLADDAAGRLVSLDEPVMAPTDQRPQQAPPPAAVPPQGSTTTRPQQTPAPATGKETVPTGSAPSGDAGSSTRPQTAAPPSADTPQETEKPKQHYTSILRDPSAPSPSYMTQSTAQRAQPVAAMGPAGFLNGRVPFGVTPYAPPSTAPVVPCPPVSAPQAAVQHQAPVRVQPQAAAPATPAQPLSSPELPAGTKLEANDLNSYVLARLKLGSAGTENYRTQMLASTDLYKQEYNGNQNWGKEAEGRINIAMAWTEKPNMDLNDKPAIVAGAKSAPSSTVPVGPPLKIN